MASALTSGRFERQRPHPYANLVLSCVACILTIYCFGYRLAGILHSRAILSEITAQQRPETPGSGVATDKFGEPDRASTAFSSASSKSGDALSPSEGDSTGFNQQSSSTSMRLEARAGSRGQIAAKP